MAERPPPLARVESVQVTAVEELAGWSTFTIERSGARGVPDVPVTVDSATCDDCLAEVEIRATAATATRLPTAPTAGPATRSCLRPLRPPCDDDGGLRDVRRRARPSTTTRRAVASTHSRMRAPCAARGWSGATRRAAAGGRRRGARGSRRGARGREGRRREGHRRLPPGGRRHERAGRRRAAQAQGEGRQAFRAHGGEGWTRRTASVDRPTPERGALVASPAHRPRSRKRDGAALASGGGAGVVRPRADAPLHAPAPSASMAGSARPLVMSSGNLSDDPIAHVEPGRLRTVSGPWSTACLTHDRPIHIRCDDSVVRASGVRLQMVRRSRGYAPEPFALPAPARRQVLGGRRRAQEHRLRREGQLGRAEPPHRRPRAPRHLSSPSCRRRGTSASCSGSIRRSSPTTCIPSTSRPSARSTRPRPWPVQHHHAHIASCMAEHRRTGRLLGDRLRRARLRRPTATMWGGEFLVADFSGFERVGHLADRHDAGRGGGDPGAVAHGARLGAARRWGPRRRPGSGARLDPR